MTNSRTEIEERASEWGIALEHEELGQTAKRQSAIRAWVEGANAEPQRAVRLGQLLALAPPGAKAHEQLLRHMADDHVSLGQDSEPDGGGDDDEGIADAIALLGDKAVRLTRLRVLVDLALEEVDDDVARIVLLASSSGELLQGPAGRRWRSIARYLSAAGQLPQVDAPEAESPKRQARATKDARVEALSEKGNEIQQFRANPHHAPYVAGAVDKIIEQLGKQGLAVNALHTELSALGGELQASLARSFTQREAVLTAMASEAGELGRLLWWGQAKYSTSLQRPFRRVETPTVQLVAASRECAELAATLPVEQSAAYLVETLRVIGVDPNERRSLRAWMEGLHEALGLDELAAHRDLSPALAALLDAAPAGLAAAWTFRSVQRGGKFEVGRAADDLGLDIGIEIDQGQWASWLFRECLLDARLKSET